MLLFESKKQLEEAIKSGASIPVSYGNGITREEGVCEIEGIWRAVVEVKAGKIIKIF